MKTLKRNDSGISPAALGALLAGDFANAAVAMTPGGIEAQEKAGQLEQARKQTLPLDLGQRFRGTVEDARKPWEALGFTFGKAVDDIFVEATFPAGWKKVPTDHSMWSEIVDEKGRKRGSIFYKAAFYDRSAHAHLACRFGVSNDYAKPLATVRVTDACGVVDFKVSGLEQPDWSGDRTEAERRQAKQDEARQTCIAYLKQNFPDCESPGAYWL